MLGLRFYVKRWLCSINFIAFFFHNNLPHLLLISVCEVASSEAICAIFASSDLHKWKHHSVFVPVCITVD